MVLIQDRIEGDQDIRENTVLLGHILGRVTVSPGVYLRVQGQITGQLMLLPGSRVIVHGCIDGDIHNESGSLKVYGRVSRTIITHTGTTLIESSAQVQAVVSHTE